MSKIGKKPIIIPQDIKIQINDHLVTITGPKGVLEIKVHPNIEIKNMENKTLLNPKIFNKYNKSLFGLTQRLLSNSIIGVTEGYTKKLGIKGVGYRAMVEGNKLILYLGFSHPIEFVAPENINFMINKNTISVSGIDKQLVGQAAALIRHCKPPEPYKGKGIRYLGEVVKIKPGKAAKSLGAPGSTA